jgi:D-inositol-3-phosphate glycosyltransferase
MTVIHSCTSDSYSGLEAYVLELAGWQYRAGQSVVLYCRENSQLEKNARAQGIPLWTIPAKAKPGPLLWAKMASRWRDRVAGGPVVLHMHAGGEPWFHMPWLSARPKNLVRTVLHFHIWINHKKKDLFHRAFYSGIDEIWTSSETAKVHLSTLLPVSRDKIRVVPYGRDVQGLLDFPRKKNRDEFRAQYNLAEDEVLGVCISRIEKIKGVRELFDAFVEIAPRQPKAHLLVIGDASPCNPEAEQYTQELRVKYAKLSDDVRRRLHLPGYLSDCRPAFAAADFYILPSYEECMSLAMLDALILGLPVIGTQSGGTPSVVRPEETGMLVPPANPIALAEALNRMYSDPEQRAQLGRGAKALGPSYNQNEIFRRISHWYEAPV